MRAVSQLFCDYCDAANPAHILNCIGVSSNAGATNDIIQIGDLGQTVNASWAWVIGQPVYIGPMGVLTQTYPTSGVAFIRVIGFANSATSIYVEIQPPIIPI